jgi:hypothetical protein
MRRRNFLWGVMIGLAVMGLIFESCAVNRVCSGPRDELVTCGAMLAAMPLRG